MQSKLSILRKYGLYLCLFGLGWLVVHVALIVWDGFSDELHQADVAVVFGNQVHRNGTPSRRLAMRLDRALHLYRQGYFRALLVSGGIGVEGHDEAKVMKRYLVTRGVPPGAIILDSAGKNTYMTMKYTRSLLKNRRWKSILLVTQYFHISRAKLTASQFGIEHVYSAHAVYDFEWREFYSIFREVIGYYAYLLKSYPR